MGVKGYPTLIYFPTAASVNGESKMCKYKGSRVLKSFQDYIGDKKWEGAECDALPGAAVEKQEEL